MKKQPKAKEGKSPETKINIHPAGDGVLLRPEDTLKKPASGSIIPDAAKQEKSTKGVVVAVGPGKMNDDGKVLPMSIKVGQKVYFSPGWESEIEMDEEKFYLIHESDVKAVIK